MPKVLNARKVGFKVENAVYVGRPSDFGNPFPLTLGRESLIEKYKEFIMRDEAFITRIKTELKGKDLICWCAPDPCHADVLLEIANSD